MEYISIIWIYTAIRWCLFRFLHVVPSVQSQRPLRKRETGKVNQEVPMIFPQIHITYRGTVSKVLPRRSSKLYPSRNRLPTNGRWMRLNLTVPDGLQTYLTPINPNGCAAQRTMWSVIMQYYHQITVSNIAVLSSNERFTPPSRDRYQIQGLHQDVDRGGAWRRKRRSQDPTPIARQAQGTQSGCWHRGGTHSGGRQSGWVSVWIRQTRGGWGLCGRTERPTLRRWRRRLIWESGCKWSGLVRRRCRRGTRSRRGWTLNGSGRSRSALCRRRRGGGGSRKRISELRIMIS